MVFEFGGSKYRFYFRYDKLSAHRVVPVGADCVMECMDTDPPVLVGLGVSRCNPCDQFRKDTARKIALERAALIASSLIEPPDRRCFRKRAWQAYHDRAKANVILPV